MKYVNRWIVVVMYIVVVSGVAMAYAQGEGQRTSKTIFERFTRPLGQAQLERPTKGMVPRMIRQRRLMVNDDGDAQYPSVNPAAAEGAEGFLAKRFNTAVGTKVDTYFFCVGNGEIPPWGLETPEAIGDANQVMIDAAREANMEIFASLRMNDIHDAWAAELTYPLKVQRPDLLIGEQHWPAGHPYLLEGEKPAARGGYPESAVLRAFWSAFDYAKPEVRQHRLEFIAQICRNYDFDGFELDYFRHPLFFKLGEEEENLDTMTEFVRRVSHLLNEIGQERGRRYVLAIRVPDSPAMARRTGLDAEQWLKEGLLDMLVVGGGYMAYAGRLKEFVDMAHRYGIPAYPCINHFQDPIKMRSYASNFWALGADGVYVFNFGGVGEGSEHEACLNQMYNPDVLLGLDKQYLPDNGLSVFYCGYSNPAGQFITPGFQGGEHFVNPIRLIDGTPIELVVGDDVQKATQQAMLAEMRLQVKVGNMDESEGITINMNGAAVPVENIKRVDKETFEAVVTAPPVRRGINQIVVLPGVNSIGRLSSTVTWLELSVRYKHE